MAQVSVRPCRGTPTSTWCPSPDRPRAGIAISQNAAKTLKKVHLELGGKGANVIFSDADDKAVKRGVLHMMNNSGQSCNAPSRMLVQRDRYDAAVEEAAAVAEQITVGPASQEGRHIGPVVNASQFEKIQGLIQTGIDEGARLVAGGPGRPEGFNRGFFVRPTVFADANNDMTIAREEIFGPVLTIMPFDTEEEAIAIANDTPYRSDQLRADHGWGARQPHGPVPALRHGGDERPAARRRRALRRHESLGQRSRGRRVWGLEDFLEVKAVSGWDAKTA